MLFGSHGLDLVDHDFFWCDFDLFDFDLSDPSGGQSVLSGTRCVSILFVWTGSADMPKAFA
jgi:hypothetical protein